MSGMTEALGLAAQSMRNALSEIDRLRAINTDLQKGHDALHLNCSNYVTELGTVRTINAELGVEVTRLHAVIGALSENIAKCDAINAELVDLLEWLDRLGGLGYEKHDRIRAAITKSKGETL